MILRIPLYSVYFEVDFLTKALNKPLVKRLMIDDIDYFRIYELTEVKTPIYDDCNEIIGYELSDEWKEVSWTKDPRDGGIVYVQFNDLININDCKRIKIQAHYTYNNILQDYNDDYNDDYSNDLGSDYSDDYSEEYVYFDQIERGFYYENDFTIFGYDLGNNFITKMTNPNPDFDIYFVVDTGQYGCDYNYDFNYAYETYSNAIAYRKPFTSEIHVYDNTTSPYDNIKWFISEQLDTPTNCNPSVNYVDFERSYETRNIIVCSDSELIIGVSKISGEQVTVIYEYRHDHDECCSCGCKPDARTIYTYCQEYVNRVNVPVNYNYFPKFELFVENECYHSLCTNVLTKNDAKVIVQYHTQYFNVDDEKKYPFSKNLLSYFLVDSSGNILDSNVYEINNFRNYNPLFNNWEFYIPDIGDYVVQAKLDIYNYDGTLLRDCTVKYALEGKHWFDYEIKQCNQFQFKNCAFEEIHVVIESLSEQKGKGFIWKPYKNFKINHLKNYKLQITEDGVYRFKVTRASNSKEYIFVEVIYCKIQECIKNITDELLCNKPCDKRFKYNFEPLNVLVPVVTLFLQKLHNVHINNYYFESIDNESLLELYDIHELYQKIMLYCYDCERLKITDCGC